ncbi:phosphatidylethanolamine N-methyltransferase, partial [Coemansia sp. RSA 2607]
LLPSAAWRAANTKNRNGGDKTMKYNYYLGESIRVAWQAPVNHSRRDWIGIYPVTSNFSNQITTASSKGCFVYTHPDENLLAEMVVGDSVFAGHVKGIANVKEGDGAGNFASTPNLSNGNGFERISSGSVSKVGLRKRNTVAATVNALQGEVLFSSSALPFKVGTYEMRLHHGGTHAVLAQSNPFEISVCDTSDIVRNLGGQNEGISTSQSGTNAAPSTDSIEYLSQALLQIVNKTFAVTDSRVVPVSKDSPVAITTNGSRVDADSATDVAVQTEIVEPLESVEDAFSVDGVLNEKQARRLGYAIKGYLGVEFASDVLIHAAKHGATVHDVAKRVVEARKALSAYSSATF